MTLYLDQHDLAIYADLAKILDVEMKVLNPELPDMWWVDREGKTRGISRKQVTEMMSLTRVEEQLSRDANHVDQLDLVIEGVVLPESPSTCQILKWSGDGRLAFRAGRGKGQPYQLSYYGYRKWIRRVEDMGIVVSEPANRHGFLSTVQAIYECSLSEGTTLKRAIRPKFNRPDVPPMVLTLMGVAGLDGRTFTGEETAMALYQRFGTINAMFTDPYEIAATRLASGRKVGPAWTEKFMLAMGRYE